MAEFTGGLLREANGALVVSGGTGGGGASSTNTETSDGVAPPLKANLIAGSDGTLAQWIKTDAAGVLAADLASAIPAGTNNIGDVDVSTLPSVAAATVAQVASSATSVTLAALNAARRGLMIFNDSTAALFVKFGATASATSFTVKIAAGGYWEMAPGVVYTGVVDGIWAAANGNAYVTGL